jgi:hypothetical protein
VLFFCGAAPAQADFWSFIGDLFGSALIGVGAITTYPIMLFAIVIGYIMATASTLFLTLSGLLVGVANHLQTLIFSSQNVIVTLGWTIVRDVANLGFVLAIILMAFTTVLRLEQYRAQKTLPKLIGAAILVNFSLEIGKIIINFAQVLTNFFLDRIAVNPLTIGTTLLAAFGPQRFIEGLNFSSFGEILTAMTSMAIGMIVSPYFITMFNLIMSFVMLILAFMLLIRFLYLSVLMIVSPIIWLFWVIPGLTGQFNKWWNKFLEWVFFAPIMAFFLYLTYYTAQGIGKFTPEPAKFDNVLSGLAATFSNVFFAGIEVIVLGGMMIAGLIMAQNMSITGAKGMATIGQKLGKGVTKGVGAWTVGDGAQKLEQWGAGGKGLAKTFTAPARLLGKGLGGIATGIERITGTRPGGPKEQPLTLMGSIIQSTKKEFKKKKRPAKGGEIIEESKDKGEPTPPGPTPPPASPPPGTSPLITENIEEEFRKMRDEERRKMRDEERRKMRDEERRRKSQS